MNSNAFRRVLISLSAALAASAALAGPVNAQTSPEALLLQQQAPGANLIASALSKLTRAELSALLSAPLAVSQGGLDDVDTASGKSLNDVLKVFRQHLERLKGPLQWMAADGTTFDCYADDVEYQWGGFGLPCY